MNVHIYLYGKGEEGGKNRENQKNEGDSQKGGITEGADEQAKQNFVCRCY